MSEKKKARGIIQWVEDDLLGYQCECGKVLVLEQDMSTSCNKCKRRISVAWDDGVEVYEDA